MPVLNTEVPAKMSGVSAVRGVSSGRPIIRITWSPPESDKPVEKYYLQYRQATSNWTGITLNHAETSTVLSGLDKGTVYHMQVRAISIAGPGPFSDLQQVITYDGKNCEDACILCRLHVIPYMSLHYPFNNDYYVVIIIWLST